MGIMSQLLFSWKWNVENCSRYKIGNVELMCGESNGHLVDRSYDLM